jgi:hypothetical protein
VFEYDGEEWVEIQKLTPSDGTPRDLFGVSPMLKGDRLIIGAPDHTNYDWFTRIGAVYIFEFDGEEWEEVVKLSPNLVELNHRFGFDLWLMDDMVLVADLAGSESGPSGEVVVYEYIEGEWFRTDALESPDPNSVDLFGGEIEVYEDVMLIGAPQSGDGIGKVYIYRLVDGIWQASGEINSPIDDPDQFFGARMELLGESVFVGAPRAVEGWGHVSVFDLACRVCRVDMDDDGVLGFEDVSVYLALFGVDASAADFNGDGQVNYFDISEFLFQFSGGC